ncbi:hypothetical protein L3Q82_014542 [Scortum barcoo]|uniref:Uncharacterized protein n=1 Tax=Scortum barcoo TaxID=214431 RepID=A0ACB8VXT8_9TELE|nr:hypothetical protein L3Q82_014542 [Scortum barcoo]
MASDLEVLILIPSRFTLGCKPPQYMLKVWTYCRQCEPSSCSGRTDTEQPLAKAPGPHTRGAPPTDTVECLLQIHKAHVDWLGKLP